MMPGLARGAPCITDTQEERPDDRRMHGCTDTRIAPERTHRPADTPPSSTDVGATRGHARAHTGAAPGHTHTSHRHARRGLCGRSEKVAALSQRVYLLICINERLCPTPPASGCRGCRLQHLFPARDTHRDRHWGSSDAAGGEGDYKVRGSERKGCSLSLPGCGWGRGEHRSLGG